jgi:hypothetical protein
MSSPRRPNDNKKREQEVNQSTNESNETSKRPRLGEAKSSNISSTEATTHSVGFIPRVLSIALPAQPSTTLNIEPTAVNVTPSLVSSSVINQPGISSKSAF